MAIEIREVVIKARVNKTIGDQSEFLTKDEFSKLQDRIIDKVMRKVRTALDEARSSR